MNKLKVLLADDNKELITVLSEYISLQEDMEVVEVAGNGNEVLSVLRQREIDILLLDVFFNPIQKYFIKYMVFTPKDKILKRLMKL